ncbi:beta-lactamase family protein [Paenibacillus alvei]|uniref:Beta-lactamase family protein n=1 Tax=Paenibacillus alvei TaxID=44250 RepID=A0ABT4H1G5_PAEAL|nr:serine hydrolase domain-containing protein [Paenibacillus alvei]EJW15482.1 putative beta-lactamase [Paenibacillus alvei DSM 29]MCY9542476.1 beta-lactamase family protein [Paenibacillus alvei]MCY9706635.1 beta-lactamase family protein [Paenibacillus alvei]MCY9736605.1 beta-lactamase family protein [Paenibacillus alvei]MCY9757959.1 beta-lactamase family protein [Paenibacillus alvei]
MNLAAWADQLLEQHGYNGSILLASHDEILISKGYGLANFETRQVINKDTIFKIASIAKQFTAVSILKLQEKGLLRVEDTLSKYVPECKGLADVTIHELLTHSSGLDEDALIDWNVNEDRRPLHTLALHTVMPAGARGEYRYSNFGYALLGLIVERLSGQPYEAFIEKELFAPFGMIRTGGRMDVLRHEANMGLGYSRGEPAWKEDIPSHNSAGSIVYSAVEDLYRWDRALHLGQAANQESLKAMFTPHVRIDEERSYGYGWVVYQERPHIRYHNGSLSGYSCTMIRDAKSDSVLIALSNLADTGMQPIEALKQGLKEHYPEFMQL